MTFARITDRAGFTYPEPGATWEGRVPPGFRPLRVRTRLGSGDAVFAAAGRAVAEWRMHRVMGVRMETDAERAEVGGYVTVGLGVGRLRVAGPCRVVWTVSDGRRSGWAYGTLPGHPECGEEGFLVERDSAGGDVWLTVVAFSRPAVRWAKAAGPLVPLFQYAYARRCGQVLRHITREDS